MIRRRLGRNNFGSRSEFTFGLATGEDLSAGRFSVCGGSMRVRRLIDQMDDGTGSTFGFATGEDLSASTFGIATGEDLSTSGIRGSLKGSEGFRNGCVVGKSVEPRPSCVWASRGGRR
jgi:hypothetical protein